MPANGTARNFCYIIAVCIEAMQPQIEVSINAMMPAVGVILDFA